VPAILALAAEAEAAQVRSVAVFTDDSSFSPTVRFVYLEEG
jgi:hypothetical protein